MVITDYPDYTDFENYVKNNFVIDFAGTAWKVSKYGVFSGRYVPVFGLNTEMYGVNRIQENTNQKKLRIWTLFTQCDYTDYQGHLKNCFITDYVDYADINNTWKKVSS